LALHDFVLMVTDMGWKGRDPKQTTQGGIRMASNMLASFLSKDCLTMLLDLFNDIQDDYAIRTLCFDSPVKASLCSVLGAVLIDSGMCEAPAEKGHL